MRLEHLDRLAASIRNQEAAARPRVPETPEAGATSFERPMDESQINPDARGQAAPRSMPRGELERIVDEANLFAVTLPQRGVVFELAEGKEGPTVQAVHPDTRQVIREMPPEEFLTFMENVRELVGLFFDQVI